jgi:hypothetical protein
METFDQRSPEWYELRAGKFTASTIYKLMGDRAILKGCDGTKLSHWSDGAQTFILEKVAETFGAFSDEAFSKATQWGIELEQYAKLHYQEAFNIQLEDRTFIMSDFSMECGFSPDSFIIGQNKGVEFKCPYNPANHIKHMLIRTDDDLKDVTQAKGQYYWQVQMSMLISGFNRWDFVSYDPRFEDERRMFAYEVQKNIDDCKLLKDRILKAIETKHNILKLI